MKNIVTAFILSAACAVGLSAQQSSTDKKQSGPDQWTSPITVTGCLRAGGTRHERNRHDRNLGLERHNGYDGYQEQGHNHAHLGRKSRPQQACRRGSERHGTSAEKRQPAHSRRGGGRRAVLGRRRQRGSPALGHVDHDVGSRHRRRRCEDAPCFLDPQHLVELLRQRQVDVQ
jgi:hypothetical protein